MKYSSDYSKLNRNNYSTIRRYSKGKVGDIVFETYPKGKHKARILSIERSALDNIPIQILIADTDLFSRKEIYDLFQSFYKKPIDFAKEKFYIYFLERVNKVKYNKCSICGIGLMEHPSVYLYRCANKNCGFSYKIDPSGGTPKIIIVCRGNYKKYINSIEVKK